MCMYVYISPLDLNFVSIVSCLLKDLPRGLFVFSLSFTALITDLLTTRIYDFFESTTVIKFGVDSNSYIQIRN